MNKLVATLILLGFAHRRLPLEPDSDLGLVSTMGLVRNSGMANLITKKGQVR